MIVRGAPLIGATAAYGLAIALAEDADDAVLRVLEEAGLDEACRVFRFKTQQPAGDASAEDLDSRLRALRSP